MFPVGEIYITPLHTPQVQLFNNTSVSKQVLPSMLYITASVSNHCKGTIHKSLVLPKVKGMSVTLIIRAVPIFLADMPISRY